MRSRRGANAIEFALTAPIFFGIMLALMDYGWFFANQAGLDNATANGCREGALQDPADKKTPKPIAHAKGEIKTRAAMFCDDNCITTVLDLNSGVYAIPQRSLQCSTSMTFAPLVGFAPVPKTITSTSFYRLEWQRTP